MELFEFPDGGSEKDVEFLRFGEILREGRIRRGIGGKLRGRFPDRRRVEESG